MISGMFYRLTLAACVVLILAAPAVAQSGNVAILPDLRLFTTMAALNAAGFDIEFGSQYHPVREAVRHYADDVDPELLAQLRNFYRIRKGDQADELQLPKYISLAVSLTDPPGLKAAVREEFLPPDARTVAGFADLVRQFYEKANIEKRWSEVEPQYRKAIDQLGPALREMIVRTDAYLRVPLGRLGPRNLAIYVELAAPLNTVNFRSYQENYYVVLGGSPNPQLDQVRHAYLHYHLDNLINTYMSRIEGSGTILGLISRSEGVDPLYASDFRVLATESLIRASELRMDRVPGARAKETVDMYYRSGLLLTPYFYEALGRFDQLEAGGIRDYFAEMIAGIKLKAEQLRFQDTFGKIPVPQKTAARPEVPEPPVAPPANPGRDLLKEGEAAFNSGNNEKAKEAFEKVLSDFDRNSGAALYGLALIASKEGDSEQAKQYFDRTVRSESAEPSMRVWAYIFMARIFDLECNRERAVEYYQQATKVGDNTRNAQNAAREGIAKAYGDACR
jgi:tetratricopeptide (TPR) repeat protein